MRAAEFLFESEGGMMRRAEEASRGKSVRFKNADGHIISIIDAVVFPEQGDREDDPAQITQQIMDYVGSQQISVQDALTLPPQAGFTTPDKAGAAMVLTFQDDTNNKKIAFIALKNTKKPGAYPIFLQTKLFSDLTGYVQLSGRVGQTDQVSVVQQRALTNLKPVGILPTNKEIAPDNIANEVEAYIQTRDDLDDDIKTQVVQLLQTVTEGQKVPVPGAQSYAKSYEIDLGETAAPIALTKKQLTSGALADAEQGMGVNFSETRGVIFPNDPHEKLYDSYMIIDNNQRVRVSSKDKQGGAKASVSGVVDDINNYPERYEGLFDAQTNPGFDELLEIVTIIKDPDMSLVSSSTNWKRNGSIAGALELGIKSGVITTEQAQRIINIIDSDQQYVDDLGDLQNVVRIKGTDDDSRPDYRIGWHLLAAVATGAANYINKNYPIDKFFKSILEKSNMIQVKTSLSKTAQGAFFNNFTVIYPPVFTGTIRLDAGSNFYATRRPVGKMGFVIDSRVSR